MTRSVRETPAHVKPVRLLRRKGRLALALCGSLILAALSVVGLRTAVADWEVRRASISGTPDNEIAARLRIATKMRPDMAELWRYRANQAAMNDPIGAEAMLQRAVRLAPTDWRNWSNLGMIFYQLGDSANADRCLRNAARLDSGYAAHLELANLAWLLGDSNQFRSEISKALRIAPTTEYTEIFQRVLHLAGPDPEMLLRVLPGDETSPVSGAIQYLCGLGHVNVATQAWRLLPSPCPASSVAACQAAALALSYHWLAKAEHPDEIDAPEQSIKFWNDAVHLGMEAGHGHLGQITDGQFHYPWKGGLSWSADSRFSLLRLGIGSGVLGNQVQVQLSGQQPDHAMVLSQLVVVRPGQRYHLSFSSRSKDLQNGQGMGLAVNLLPDRQLTTLPARAESEWVKNEGIVNIPANTRLVQIGLAYNRPVGVAPMRGEFFVADVELKAMPKLASGQTNSGN